MISKRFNGKKATEMTKRKLGLESLENREMLNGLSLLATPDTAPDTKDYDQTVSSANVQSFASISPMSVVASSVTATVVSPTSVQVDFTTDDTANYKVMYKLGTGAYKTFKTVAGINDDQSVTVTGLKAGAKYTFAVQDVDGNIEESSVITTPLSVTVTGITTSAATLKWSAPDASLGVKVPYTVVILDGSTELVREETRSTSFEVTGLTPGTTGLTYEIYATGTITTPLATGTFDTEAAGPAEAIVVGAPTGVKTTFQKATTSNPVAKLNVSWTAPTNYDGGYVVTISDQSGTKVFDITVPKGKTLLTIPVGDAEITTPGSETLAKDTEYQVYVTANASTAIASSTTYFKTSASIAPAQPQPPAAVVAAALSGIPGGLELSVTAPSNTTGIVGYYVGVYAGSTPPLPGSTSLTFIEASDVGSTTIEVFGVSSKAKAVAYSVAVDGTYSLATILATVSPTPTPAITERVTGVNGKLIFEQDSTDPTKGTLSWTQGADLANKTLNGWYVSYSLDKGKTWIYDDFVTAGTAGDTISQNLSDLTALGIPYQFQVVASYTDTNSTESLGRALALIMSQPLQPKVAAPGKAKTPIVDNEGTEAEIHWTYPVGANVIKFDIKVYDSNKALIAADSTIASDPTQVVDYTYQLTGLTPGSKYSVEITALTDDPYVKSTTYKITVQTPVYQPATLKAGTTTILQADITLTDVNSDAADANTSYYIEYTYIVDGKGRPDWNAAKVLTVASSEFLQSNSVAKTLTGLNPNTQYYARVVKVTTDGSDPIMAVNGKEIKFKTAMAPMATIQKSGFAMDGTDFGFKFTAKTPYQNDTKKILSSTTTFNYTILVSSASTTNLSTGMLENAVTFSGPTGDDGKAEFVSDVVLFSALAAPTALGDLQQYSSLYFQLKVEYVDSGTTYATLYTKAGKIVMPKWFS